MSARLDSIAGENEVDYKNIDGNLVEWKFREVLEVQEVTGDSVDDGAEVYFRYWENPQSREFETMRMTP